MDLILGVSLIKVHEGGGGGVKFIIGLSHVCIYVD